VDRLGDSVGEEWQRLEVVEVGTLDGVDAAHRLDQLGLTGFAESRNSVERARGHALRPALDVERVGEPVGLVADPLQHEERLAPPRDLDRLGPVGHEHLLEPFGESGDRDLVGESE
jgi:hypothetical protein